MLPKSLQGTNDRGIVHLLQEAPETLALRPALVGVTGGSMSTSSSEAKKSAKPRSEKSSTYPRPRTESTRSSTSLRSRERIELILILQANGLVYRADGQSDGLCCNR